MVGYVGKATDVAIMQGDGLWEKTFPASCKRSCQVSLTISYKWNNKTLNAMIIISMKAFKHVRQMYI